MSLVIHRKSLLCNYDPVEIEVEFLILHYTGVGFLKTLDIFQDPSSQASAHLLVNQAGEVYELVSCLKGRCFRAWHAGESYWQEGEKKWRQFNDFSIGIELVNKNGNLFEYTKKQYKALKMILEQLKKHYPALKNPERVLGHEHIASYRGKVDPGHCFDWPLFFKMNYLGEPLPLRFANLSRARRKMFFNRLPPGLKASTGLEGSTGLKASTEQKKISEKWTDEDWIQFNTQMETQSKPN